MGRTQPVVPALGVAHVSYSLEAVLPIDRTRGGGRHGTPGLLQAW